MVRPFNFKNCAKIQKNKLLGGYKIHFFIFLIFNYLPAIFEYIFRLVIKI